MSVSCESYIAARFDALEGRFHAEVGSEDVRLSALRDALGKLEGRRVLDLGCGKGRFARPLQEAGAAVIGLDLSAGMLASADGLARVRASARRLPFAASAFDAVVAVEVLEHVHAVGDVLEEVHRVLRPGGIVAIVDKNAAALDARRPWLPSAFVKWIDERRGLWMYPADAPVRERWFWPKAMARLLETHFEDVRVAHLMHPQEERWAVFRRWPPARLLTLWTARRPAGGGVPGSLYPASPLTKGGLRGVPPADARDGHAGTPPDPPLVRGGAKPVRPGTRIRGHHPGGATC